MPFWQNARGIAGVFFLCAVLNGCAVVFPQTSELRERWPADVPQRAELADVPFFAQNEYQCGPAALASVLAHFKASVTPDELVGQVYIPARKGSVQAEMLAAPRRYAMVSYTLAPRYDDLLREIAAGIPVIVLQNYGAGPLTIWHYAVAIGFDAHSGDLVLRSGETERLTLPLPVFEYTWKDSGYWAMVALPPSLMPVTADRARYLDAIVALERANQPHAAAVAYARFLERWPEELAASIGLANAYYALGELGQAETALRRALARHPGSVVVLNNLAQTVSDAGRADEALELIDRAAAAGGPHADAVRETRRLILQKLK